MTSHHYKHYKCYAKFEAFSLAIIIIIVIDIILFVRPIRTVHSDQNSIVVNRFPKRIDPKNILKFNNLALNITETKAVFIGATNWLFQLDLDLNPLHNISLTQYFNGDCRSQKRSNCSSLPDTWFDHDQNSDYVTKALVIDWTNHWLIACGTWQHGACLITDLHNISNVLFQPQEMVVADDLFNPAVAFIAPGPSSSSSPSSPAKTRMVLYVASHYTIERSEIVASRSLEPETLMSFAYSDVSSGTRLNIKSDIGPDFHLRYVYGFQSEGYSFFLLVRSKNHNYQHMITKLVRICQNDNRYYSYTEVPITCDTPGESDSGQAYAAYLLKAQNVSSSSSSSSSSQQTKSLENQEYLFVIFQSSTNIFLEQDSRSSSTLCIYPMWEIHEKFNQNIGKCFAGQGLQNIPYVHTYLTPCQHTNMTIEDYACGSDVNQQLDTEDPIFGDLILTTESPIKMTSVLADWINNRMIVFVGNSHGQLSKHWIKNISHDKTSFPFLPWMFKAQSYGQYNLTVEPEPILSEMAIVHDHVYLMFSDKVLKVKIQQCDQFKTCTECIASNDPYCGWCLSENSCSPIDQCHERSDWIYKHTDEVQCARIAYIRPSSIAISTRKSIQIIVENLKFPVNFRKKILKLWCEFHFVGNFSDASKKPNPILVLAEQIDRINQFRTKIICSSPDERLLPDIPSNNHSLHSRLVLTFGPSSNSIKYQSVSFPIDETSFNFYDCPSYSTCIDCVNTRFRCVWCLAEHVCKHNESVCSMDKRLARVNSLDFLASNYCPQIVPVAQKTKFLVHEESMVNVSVFLLNYSLMPKYKIECRFNISSVSGYLSTVGHFNEADQTIKCKPKPLVFAKNAPHADNFSQLIVPLEILVNGYRIDNPYNIHLVIYRCRKMAKTCDECLSLDPEYGCGWCARDDTLINSEVSECHQYSHCIKSHRLFWIDQTSELACPDPKIIDFNPKSGPFQGGTMLTVVGENLGRSLADLSVTIYVSKKLSINCRPQVLWKGKTLKCLLDYDPTNGVAKHNQAGPIVIRIKDQHQTQSHQWYCFLQPKLISFNPGYGPISGGTIVHVTGDYLDCGSKKWVLFGAKTCQIQNVTSSTFEMITPKVEWDQALSILSQEQEWRMIINITMVIDQTKLYFSDDFYLLEDPEIDIIKLLGSADGNQHPTMKNDYIGGIPSGGIHFLVYGKRLNVVQDPKFYVEIDYDTSVGLESFRTARQEPMQPKMFQSDCRAVNKTLMICETPKVPEEVLKKLFAKFNINSNYTLLNFGFIMDDCQKLWSLTLTSTKFPLFRMYRQPRFHQFKTKDLIKHVMDQEYLTISGENLDSLAPFSGQTIIWIGGPNHDSEIPPFHSSSGDNVEPKNTCKIISYTSKHLICRLPLIGPQHSLPHADGTYVDDELAKLCKMKVQISIGNVKTSLQSIGFVDYCHHDNRAFLSGPYLWIIIGLFLVLVSLVTVLVIYFKFITKKQRKKLQSEKKEREQREMAINKEAREAFSQMQLGDRSELIALTANPDNVANICHPFETFALNTLLNLKKEAPSYMPGLLRKDDLTNFAVLIQDKKFLLLLIQTLDNNKNFPLKDRINFGSNLVMALSDKMFYLTEVMLDLLKKYIEHHQKSGLNTLKILLRRNEQIVERVVSTWLTLLLYDHLLEADLPKSFYQLYLAIKSSCYSNPVDQITGNAKYTLSLEQLLRVQVEYKPITIIVSIFDDSETIAYKINSVHNSSEFDTSEYSEDHSRGEEDLSAERHIYEKLIPKINHDYEENQYKKSKTHQVIVLSCDTIEQVIRKSLDIIYKSVPYSKRPYTFDVLDLECVEPVHHLDQKILKNRDQTSERTTQGNVCWHRLNTVGHYQIDNGEEFCLIPKDFRDTTKNISVNSIANTITTSIVSLSTSSKLTNEKPRARTKSLASNVNLSTKITRPSANNAPLAQYCWHLMKAEQEDSHHADGLVKLSADIQQPRCLAFKVGIEPFVDGLFQRILSINDSHKKLGKSNSPLITNGYAKLMPKSNNGQYEEEEEDDDDDDDDEEEEIVCKPIKFIFDFFDQQAEAISNKMNEKDLYDEQIKEELCHIWKSNCLPLRVWANLLANPEFLLDVEPDPVVKYNLMIINQIFMESCSVNLPRLNKNSPPSKLCFSNDFPKYNRWVRKYYQRIRQSKSITAKEMKIFLDKFSERHSSKIDQQAALSVLFEFCLNHRELVSVDGDQEQKNNITDAVSFNPQQIIQTLANSNNRQLCARFQLIVPGRAPKS